MANNALVGSDYFLSGSLAAGWSALNGFSPCVVVSQQAETTLSAKRGQSWTGNTFGSDQISEIKVGTLTVESGSWIGMVVRAQAGAQTWYEADLNNGSLYIYRYSNGTGTQIGATIAVTVASGDVFTFMAAGALLMVYQNGNPLAISGGSQNYIVDTNITGGTPGFWIYTTVAVGHATVAAWRGYSGVQQDGVWQKQGIVIPLTAADLVTSGDGVFNTTQILHEGNAQILSGTVYKVLAKGGTAGGQLLYFESTDGVNWTRYGSPVLTGGVFTNAPVLMKSGATYYLYINWANASLTDVYTSPDMINWTHLAGSLNITGTPFGGVFWNGTFYVFGLSNNSTFQTMNVNTSTDGQTFTPYAGNPVITNCVGSAAIAQVNGTWYMWSPTAPTSTMGNSVSIGDPSETVRHSSTDLLHWDSVPAVRSVHRGQLFEGLNVTAHTGGNYASAIIDIGGKAHLYYLATPWDSSTPEPYQISMAIAPVPIAQLALYNEDAAQLLATDNFQRGSMGANWTTPSGATAVQIASNLVEASALSAYCAAVYTAKVFTGNQYSEVTLATLNDSFSSLSPMVMGQTGAQSWYAAVFHGGSSNASIQLVAKVSGTDHNIGPATVITPAVSDVYRLAVVLGSDGFPVLSFYQNGALVVSWTDYNSYFSSGSPGLVLYTTSNITYAQISAWAGGNLGVLPYPASGGDIAPAFDLSFRV